VIFLFSLNAAIILILHSEYRPIAIAE